MKAISIQQPWAWAILHAGKDIENRSWSTAYRGELAVHATRVQAGYQLPTGVACPPEQDLIVGSVIGLVELADVVERSSSRWFSGPFGFVLRNARPLARPVRCRGNLKLWDLPAAANKAILERIASCDQRAAGRVCRYEPRDELTGIEPTKAGQPWTTAEEAELLREFAAGGKIRELARKHGRTDLSIRGRLYRLGKLPAWSASRQRDEEAAGVW